LFWWLARASFILLVAGPNELHLRGGWLGLLPLSRAADANPISAPDLPGQRLPQFDEH